MIFLINSRGQAFSVFELLIAAIVAIAILFVLLPIISGIILPTGEPIQEIGNVIAQNNYTITHTKVFSFGPNQPIVATVFENKIDPCSIFFNTSDFPEERLSTEGYKSAGDSQGKCNTIVRNMTNSQVRATATIVCAQDGGTLGELVRGMKSPPAEFDIPDDLADEDIAFNKICAVIFKRA